MLNQTKVDLNNPLVKELIELYKKADQILTIDPSLDREFVVQTLLFLKKSPKERLRRALLRGRFFKQTTGLSN